MQLERLPENYIAKSKAKKTFSVRTAGKTAGRRYAPSKACHVFWGVVFAFGTLIFGAFFFVGILSMETSGIRMIDSVMLTILLCLAHASFRSLQKRWQGLHANEGNLIRTDIADSQAASKVGEVRQVNAIRIVAVLAYALLLFWFALKSFAIIYANGWSMAAAVFLLPVFKMSADAIILLGGFARLYAAYAAQQRRW